MLRHVIAPAHAFAQIPNVILRHPRLSSDAKNLLNWQLSLPSNEKQCLSDTARQAGVKKCAFQKAKRQLLDEGFLHQWTVQKDGGLFATIQLISNTPLSAKEALAVRDGLRPAPGGARIDRDAGEGEGQPSVGKPAAGQPTGPVAGRLPEENTGEITTQPTSPHPEPEAEPPPSETAGPVGGRESAQAERAAAEALLLSLGRLDPQLAMPAHTARRWAPLAAKWLAGGMSPLGIRHALTDGLEGARNPLGALRWRLENTLPEVPEITPPPPSDPRPEARVTGMRECRTRHTQPRLFTPPPGSDEELCPDCRVSGHPESASTPESAGSGYAEFTAARGRRPSARGRVRGRHAERKE
ncbi:hypothetical protein N566_26810 [Streptomycetaceae bacterium MP113-05]|nr:hypothetical protein N566_26810 [Streptomycetaceae bacterium MP113-05]